MEIQLQELIDKIKKEGLEKTKSESETLRHQAEEESGRIVAEARSQADRLLAQAKAEADRLLSSGKASLQLAARDVNLTVQKSLKALFTRLVGEAVKEAYSSKVLETAIIDVAKAWAGNSGGITIEVPESAVKAVQAALKSKLSEAALKGISVEASPRVQLGFRISEAGGAAYYDFSDQNIAEALSEYVNPALAELVKGSDA